MACNNTDLYANDTTLHDIKNSVENIEKILQIALDSLNAWCKCNGMLLNSSKTNHASNNKPEGVKT